MPRSGTPRHSRSSRGSNEQTAHSLTGAPLNPAGCLSSVNFRKAAGHDARDWVEEHLGGAHLGGAGLGAGLWTGGGG